MTKAVLKIEFKLLENSSFMKEHDMITVKDIFSRFIRKLII